MLTTLVTSETFNGNDATTEWAFSFKVWDYTTDLEIWLTDANGAETEITSNFTVVVAGDGTGTVYYPTIGDPVATGEKLTLRRVLPVKQDYFDPSNNQAFLAEVIEDSQDRIVAMVQQVKTDVVRSVKLAISEDPDTIDVTLPQVEAGKILGWNATGDGLVNLAASTLVIGAGAVDTTELADLAVTEGKLAADAVSASKIKADVAGAGLGQNVGTGALEIPPGESTIHVSSGDTTLGPLDGKLVAGSNMTLTKGNVGANENLSVDKKFRGAMAFLTTVGSVTLVSGNSQYISWTNEVYDTDGFIDLGVEDTRITIPANVSFVRLSCQLQFRGTATTSALFVAFIYKNNSGSYPGGAWLEIDDEDTIIDQTMFFATSPIAVSEGDYFEVLARWNDTGGSSTGYIQGGTEGNYCWFAIEVIE